MEGGYAGGGQKKLEQAEQERIKQLSGKLRDNQENSESIASNAKRLDHFKQALSNTDLQIFCNQLDGLPNLHTISSEGITHNYFQNVDECRITIYYGSCQILNLDSTTQLLYLITGLDLEHSLEESHLLSDSFFKTRALIIKNCTKEELKKRIEKRNTELTHANIIISCIDKLMANQALEVQELANFSSAIDQLSKDINASLLTGELNFRLQIFGLFTQDKIESLKGFLKGLLSQPGCALETTPKNTDSPRFLTIKNFSKSRIMAEIKEKNTAITEGNKPFSTAVTESTDTVPEKPGESFMEVPEQVMAALDSVINLMRPAMTFLAKKTPDLSRVQIASISAAILAVTLIVLYVLDELPEADNSQVISDGKEARATSLPMQFTAQAPAIKPDMPLLSLPIGKPA